MTGSPTLPRQTPSERPRLQYLRPRPAELCPSPLISPPASLGSASLSLLGSTSDGVEVGEATHPDASHPASPALGDEFAARLEFLRLWIATLSNQQRMAAFGVVAGQTCRAEIPPLVEALTKREHKLWERWQEKKEKQGLEEKPPMPPVPRDGDAQSDPWWLSKWLRSLRLHKYEPCLRGLGPSDILRLTEEDLTALGIDTVGARRKLLRVINDSKIDIDETIEALRESNTPDNH
ncbi:hypothetical protein GQ53DRAFT_875446 [Thozetella sp. PMI_491]|nr:hypothetical protein GQ53DRAFT_875446 [Thozetella sp. PMI_491]